MCNTNPIKSNSIWGSTDFQKTRSNPQVLRVRSVTRSKVYTRDPEFWSDLKNSLFLLENVNLYTCILLREKTAIIILKTSSATGQTSVTKVTRHFGIAHP